MNTEKDVSIIIVNWNTVSSLRDCLASVYSETKDISFEVIVVDNASTDGSPEMVRREFPQAILVENDQNKGFAGANNQGLAIVKGPYVLLLNSDTIILDNAIEKIVKHADIHPEAAVTGCQVWESPYNIQITCFRFPSVLNVFLQRTGLAWAFKYNHFFGREWILWWQRDSEREVDVVSGMFMLVRCEAIEQVGMMDESYFMYFEDTDWCYRFAKRGWKRLFWPGAKIMHLHSGGHSTRQVALQMFVQQQKSLLRFFKKHHGPISALLVRLMLVLSFGLRCCMWVLISVGRSLSGKRLTTQAEKIQEYWWGFKFALFSCEPAKKG